MKFTSAALLGLLVTAIQAAPAPEPINAEIRLSLDVPKHPMSDKDYEVVANAAPKGFTPLGTKACQ